MGASENIQEFIKELKEKLKSKMPEVRKEIQVYEAHLKNGTLVARPKPSPQFNG